MHHLYKLILAFLLIPNLVLAQQNLVPNWSFEDTTHCPFATGDIWSATGWYSAKGSPDYFHPCANYPGSYTGVPDNFSGYQVPYQGQTYAGIISYVEGYTNYREYIGIPLTEPLIVGTEYFISGYISRGDSIGAGATFDCATNKFGFRFSTLKFDALNFTPAPTDNFAHIYSDEIITDSVNWTQISGSLIADSAYTYLIFGNFYNDDSTSTLPCSGTAYYYVDDVCVSTSATTCEVINGLSYPSKPAEITLFPNPTRNTLELQYLTGQNQYAILSATGTRVKSGTLSETEHALDVSALPNGLYFLQLNGKQSFKFVVAR